MHFTTKVGQQSDTEYCSRLFSLQSGHASSKDFTGAVTTLSLLSKSVAVETSHLQYIPTQFPVWLNHHKIHLRHFPEEAKCNMQTHCHYKMSVWHFQEKKLKISHKLFTKYTIECLQYFHLKFITKFIISYKCFLVVRLGANNHIYSDAVSFCILYTFHLHGSSHYVNLDGPIINI